MITMRNLMTLFEDAQIEGEIDEAGAGPSRVVQHIRDGNVFIMLSAMRSNMSHAENLQRTEKLKQMLTTLPVSYFETAGEYTREGETAPSPEISFFIMPRKANAAVTAPVFRDFGIKLMHTFDQESILYGDGETATLIFQDGTTADLGNTVTFRPEIIKNLGGSSKIKGRVFSFTDAPTAAKPVEKPDQTQEPTKTHGTAYGDDPVKKIRA
jgi:hypothetical protein